jgi:hypothetical protein
MFVPDEDELLAAQGRRQLEVDRFEGERAALENFLLTYSKRDDVVGYGWGYDPTTTANLPRWFIWGDVDRIQRLQTWNCTKPKCQSTLLRLVVMSPIIAVVEADESVDGLRHEHEIHPGGLAFITNRVPKQPGLTTAERKAAREERGRSGVLASLGGATVRGWWYRDEHEPGVTLALQCWCTKCSTYRVVWVEP